jgi:hypothetical protein
MRRRVILKRGDEVAAAAAVGTILLVVITVAMIVVVGVFAFNLVKMPEQPPTMDVVYTHLNDRWSIHITDLSEEIPLDEFRLIAYHENGDFATYDPDGDAVADTLVVTNLADIATASGSGPQASPVVFVDTDGDGMVSIGDQFVVLAYYMPASNLFMDGNRGFKLVGEAPHGIPADSNLAVAASAVTLPGSNLAPGDTINLELKHGSTVEADIDGVVGAGGFFTVEIYIDPAWHRGNHKATFIVREGEVDEWPDPLDPPYQIKVLDEEAITPAQEEQYDQLMKPLLRGDTITLVHIGSNSVVLEFKL